MILFVCKSKIVYKQPSPYAFSNQSMLDSTVMRFNVNDLICSI